MVTGIGGDLGLSVISVLCKSEMNLCLLGCDVMSHSPGRLFVDTFMVCPKADHISEYTRFLQQVIKKYSIDLIVPTSLPELYFFNVHRRMFSDLKTKVLIHSGKVFSLFDDKLKTIKFLDKQGFLVPEYYETKEAIQVALREKKVIIKPRQGSGSRNIQVVQSEKDTSIDKINFKEYVVQEFIESEDEVTLSIVRSRKSFFYIAFLRELGPGGMTVFARIFEHHSLKKFVTKFVKTISFSGSINIQLKLKQGRLYPFEINPRLSSTVFMRHVCGFKDCEWWVSSLLNLRYKIVPEIKKNAVIYRTQTFIVHEGNQLNFKGLCDEDFR